MSDVKWSAFVAGLAEDTIGGSEKVPLVDGSTPKYVTTSSISTYVITNLTASAAVTPTSGDAFLMERSGTAKTVDIAALSSHVIATAWTANSETGSATNADKLVIERSGTIYELDIDTLATYVNSAVLDLTALSAATPGSSDLILFGSGATPKKITLANFETQLWTDYKTHVTGLSAVTTTADSDKFYCIQGGTAKYVTPVQLKTYMGISSFGNASGPGATTENKIPQWDSTTRLLKDGLTLQTTVRASASAVDTALATEQAVAERVDAVITEQSKINDPAAAASMTQDALTDNGGGTANNTVDSHAPPSTITDRTGVHGSHNDTVAAFVALTNYSAHSSGGTTVTSNAATDLDTTAAALATLENECTAAFGVVNQNVSDLAQKIIEIVTLFGTTQNNFKEVTTQLGKIKTDTAALKTAVDANNTAIDSIIDALEANDITADS